MFASPWQDLKSPGQQMTWPLVSTGHSSQGVWCSPDGQAQASSTSPWGVGGMPPQWAAPVVMSHSSHIPSGDTAMLLGEHLQPATREKILRGEFVDFFSMLYQEVEKRIRSSWMIGREKSGKR